MTSRLATVTSLRREHAHLLGGSVWLLAATLVVSVGSIIFWLLVARSAAAQDVGRATALFSATMFVCYLTSLGLPIGVSRYATDRTPGDATLFAWALFLSVASSLVGVIGLAVIASHSIRDGLATWPPGLAWSLVFLLMAGLAISTLVDVRLMALRRWSLVFWRAVLIATMRLPLLLWIPESGAAVYIYAVAAGGFAVTGVAFLIPLAQQGWLRLRPLPENARRAARFAGVNYLGQLALQAPFFAVPFAVLTQVDAVENAHFYLSWGVMAVVYMGIQMISQALLVEGGRDGADDHRQAGVAMGVGLAVAIAATAVSLALGPLLADFYGSDYGPVATLLPVLMAGTIPFAVSITMLTTARIREHSHSTLAMAAASAVCVLIPTVLLVGSNGGLGAAWGWTIGNVIAALLAFPLARLPERRSKDGVQTGAAATTPIAPIPD